MDVWIKAKIPTVSLLRVKQKLVMCHQELRNVLKKKGDHKENGIKKLKENSSHLFDIAACQCADIDSFTCDRDSKVPVVERKFLTNQRGSRQMVIGKIDSTQG